MGSQKKSKEFKENPGNVDESTKYNI